MDYPTASSSNDRLRFTVAPVPPPHSCSDLGSLSKYADQMLWDQFKTAFDIGLLPPTTDLAQFVHLDPQTLNWRLAMPTVVRTADQKELLAAFAFQASFLESSKLSVFRNESQRNADKGLILVASYDDFCDAESVKCIADVVKVRCTTTRATASTITATFSPVLEPSQHYRDWTFYNGQDVLTSAHIDGGIGDAILNNLCATDTDLLDHLVGDQADAYFSHLIPMLQRGTVIFCIPRIYSRLVVRDDAPRIGGGGCVFLVRGRPDGQLLEDLYLISYKLRSLVLSVCDLASSLQENQRTRDLQEHGRLFSRLVSHEFTNLTAIVKALISKAQKANNPRFLDEASGYSLAANRIANSFLKAWYVDPATDAGTVGDLTACLANTFSYPGVCLRCENSVEAIGRLTIPAKSAALGVLGELIRNAIKHTPDKYLDEFACTVHLTVKRDFDDGYVVWEVANRCDLVVDRPIPDGSREASNFGQLLIGQLLPHVYPKHDALIEFPSLGATDGWVRARLRTPIL